ncbi:hypothetical protein NUACC21_34620 [Scytonema sp. NUACC21]
MKRLREEAMKKLDALLPSILDKAFKPTFRTLTVTEGFLRSIVLYKKSKIRLPLRMMSDFLLTIHEMGDSQ